LFIYLNKIFAEHCSVHMHRVEMHEALLHWWRVLITMLLPCFFLYFVLC